jgi:hypothetical protein
MSWVEAYRAAESGFPLEEYSEEEVWAVEGDGIEADGSDSAR